MREKVLCAGEGGRLIGIRTEPEWSTADRPWFLLLNAGLVHRVGPNRLYVELARRLARTGFPVCRFDTSGLGDSDVRRERLPYAEARIRDVADVMQSLEALYGAQHFVLVGLCSGADHAFRSAKADRRVVGTIMLDGYVYPALAYRVARAVRRLREIGRRVFQADPWRRLARGRHPIWGTLRAGLTRRPDLHMQFRMEVPSRLEAVESFRDLMDRDVRMLFVYTDRRVEIYRQSVRGGTPFPPAAPPGRVRVVCIPESDHEFTLIRHQQRLFEEVAKWATRMWSLSATAQR